MPRSIEKLITSLDNTYKKLEHELDSHGVYDDVLESFNDILGQLEEINEEINDASKEEKVILQEESE